MLHFENNVGDFQDDVFLMALLLVLGEKVLRKRDHENNIHFLHFL